MTIDWNARIWPLMEEAFPPVERRTYEGQAATLAREEVNLRVLTEGERVTGLLIWWDLNTCLFVEHLAVSRECRGGGRGALLLQGLCREAKKPVVLEIEPPMGSEQALRRLHFYRKNGFVLNDFPYKQQPLKPGDAPEPLCILSYRSGFTARQFLPLKEEIYRTVYNLQGEALRAAL